MPQGSNVTVFRTGFTAHRLVPVDLFLLFVFDIPDFKVHDTDPRPGYSACPDFAVHRLSTLDPRLRHGFYVC